ncbi:hypothetical protein GCM10018953_66030 [Streptosporangium nondiastaticum]
MINAAKEQPVKPSTPIEGRFQITTNNVGQEIEYPQNVRLPRAVRPDQYVDRIEGQRHIPQAEEVLHPEFTQTPHHDPPLSRPAGTEVAPPTEPGCRAPSSPSPQQ